MRSLALPLLVTAFAVPAVAQPAKKKVAVLELQNPAGLSDQEASYLTNVVRGQAVNSLPAESFQVMTRENILEYLPPGTDLAQCEGACEVETGRRVGADYVITGDIIRFGTQLKVSLRMHDTNTSQSKAAEDASGATVDDLEEPVKQAARRVLAPLLSGLRSGPVPRAKVEVRTVPEPADDGSRIKNPPRDEKGYLVVTCNPVGAEVVINGERKGMTSGKNAYQVELMVGDYVVLCRPTSNLYAAASQRVTVTHATQRVTMELPPTFGHLKVESDPPGADILLGGEPTGEKTPHTFKQRPGGRYPVTVTRPLYKSASQTVEMGGGRETAVRLVLEPDFGVLEVTSSPSGAEILINGVPSGQKTPHKFKPQKSGDYEVTVALPPLYLPQTRRVRLADGRVTKVDVALDANFGSVAVTSEPSNMPVLLDGQRVGKTPLTLEQVPTGVHELKIDAPTHAAAAQRVNVARGETAQAHFELKPRLGRLNLTAVVVDGDVREPAEAEVWIDGEYQPTPTPFKKNLLVGRYQLKLRADSAEPKEERVDIKEGDELRLEVQLKKLLPEEVKRQRAQLALEREAAERQRQAEAAAEARASRKTVSNWLLGIGIGTVAVGGGGFVASRTLGMNSVNNATTPAELDDAIGTGRTLGMGGAAVVGVGVALLVASMIASPGE
jgi:TolB-like protein